jgi:hypothetical protein
MDRAQLLETLTQDILTYAMQGGFPEQKIATAIKPDALDARFEEYELLLDLHFILQPEVVAFVEALPKQLRSIRTETQTVSQTRRGTVDGHINWGATIKTRYAQNPSDRSLFVCENRSEDYDIAENLVLKKLLSVIYTTLQEADAYLRGDYAWVQETWKGDGELIDDLTRIVDRNVHVRRIREPETYEPTERMLTQAANARQEIYRKAASLLRTRNDLFAGDPEAIQALLDQTAITPDDEHALFELFVLFRFIGTIEAMQDDSFTFKTIARDRQEVARLDGDKEIVIYHDNSAKDRDLSFDANVRADDQTTLSRTEKVQTVAKSVANTYFTDRSFQDHTGRPDVIVLEVIDESTNQHEYLIAEVKNSTNIDTIRQGIKETVEYIAFLRVNDDFVFEAPAGDDYFGSGWNGMLIVQDLDEETAALDEQGDSEVKILQASELESQLGTVLEHVL